MITDVNSEDRLVQETFVDHLEIALGGRASTHIARKPWGAKIDVYPPCRQGRVQLRVARESRISDPSVSSAVFRCATIEM